MFPLHGCIPRKLQQELHCIRHQSTHFADHTSMFSRVTQGGRASFLQLGLQVVAIFDSPACGQARSWNTTSLPEIIHPGLVLQALDAESGPEDADRAVLQAMACIQVLKPHSATAALACLDKVSLQLHARQVLSLGVGLDVCMHATCGSCI